MTDPHVQDYADRIAAGLRYDKIPNRMEAPEAQMVATRYGAELTFPSGDTYTIREVSLAVAGALSS